MIYRKTRSIAFLLLLALLASLLSVPVLAAGEEEPSDAEEGQATTLEELLSAEPLEETPEIPLVGVLELEDEPETPEEPAAAEESGEPEEPAEPAETEEPEEIPAESEEPAEPEEIVEEDAASGEPELDASGEPTYVVSYYSGETLLGTESVEAGSCPSQMPAQNGSGKAITGWLNAAGGFKVLTKTVINEDTAFYAWYAPALEMSSHIRYIGGMGNGLFGPDESLTRAQAAQILYNLLVEKNQKGSYACTFSDVYAEDWYYTAVTTLASYHVLTGYEDGTFRPNQAVTRAEFVTILVRMFGMEDKPLTFTDVAAGSWAADYIATAAARNWINGYGGGIFLPDNPIRRCEAVAVVNRVLGRTADKEAISGGENILHYLDVNAENGDWWYWDVMEASIAHEYETVSGGEHWLKYTVESCGLTPGFHTIGGNTYYVRSDTLQFAHMDAAIIKVEGQYFYAEQTGYVIDEVLDQMSLTGGFKRINDTLFYWDAAKKEPLYLTKGLNQISGKTYYAAANGYVIDNTFGAGPVERDGKLYLSDGACAIITTAANYSIGTKTYTNKDLKNCTYEFDKNMYYIQSDYSLAQDKWVGYLYFDSNGKYTTGDTSLDTKIYNALLKAENGYIDNTGLTQVQRLLKAYYYLRGGEGKVYKDSGFYYMQTGQGFARTRYNGQTQYSWQINCAKHFLTNYYGICYNWACTYLFMARRLGFQAYAVVGNIFNDKAQSDDARHCWCMIQWDSKWHISDVEIEWGYLKGFYTGGVSEYWNLFDQTVSSENIKTYTNPECSAVKYFFKDEA